MSKLRERMILTEGAKVMRDFTFQQVGLLEEQIANQKLLAETASEDEKEAIQLDLMIEFAESQLPLLRKYGNLIADLSNIQYTLDELLDMLQSGKELDPSLMRLLAIMTVVNLQMYEDSVVVYNPYFKPELDTEANEEEEDA